MIDPKKVMVITPNRSGNVPAAYAGGLAAATSQGLVGHFSFLQDCSCPRLVRSLIVDKFLATPFDWLFMIDDDIGFSHTDVKLMLGATLDRKTDFNPILVPAQHPEPTRDADGNDVLIVAEYAKRTSSPEVVEFGLGFTLIARSVIEQIADLEDEHGAPRVGRFRKAGGAGEVLDLFPNGPLGMSGDYMTEDRGFFLLCQLTGVVPRIERRTRLVHYGQHAWPYDPNGRRSMPPPANE